MPTRDKWFQVTDNTPTSLFKTTEVSWTVYELNSGFEDDKYEIFWDLYIRESPYSTPRKNTKHMPFLQVLNGILWARRMLATPSVGNALGMITISQIIRVSTVCLKIHFLKKKKLPTPASVWHSSYMKCGIRSETSRYLTRWQWGQTDRLAVYLGTHLSICLSFRLPSCPPRYISLTACHSPSVHPPNYPLFSFYLSTHLPTHTPTYTTTYLPSSNPEICPERPGKTKEIFTHHSQSLGPEFNLESPRYQAGLLNNL